MITLTREEAQQVLDALEYNQANWQGKNKAIETLRTRLSQCERCGEVNPAEIHTCTPQETVLLSYWQEEARRYAENAEYWRSKCNAQPEPDIVQDAVVYGTGITKDGKRIDPASIYKEPEPVAWGIANTRPTEKQPLMMVMLDKPEPSHLVVPLYTAPLQREWQGLTDDEIRQLEIMEDEEDERKGWCDPKLLIAWTQALLKEKNT